VTDDDIIEKSNLSCQLLFRNHKLKRSSTKKENRKQLNPALPSIWSDGALIVTDDDTCLASSYSSTTNFNET